RDFKANRNFSVNIKECDDGKTNDDRREKGSRESCG
ncbi:hypothetical protein TcasGA2_TC012986, partial [Tribolium castaneum]